MRRRLVGAVPDDIVDTAELCVSELATNSVLHACTEFVVRVRPEGPGARVMVTDGSVVPPRQVPYGFAAATGRGLDLVANLSRQWGVELAADGKTVWCEVCQGDSRDLDQHALLEAWGDLLADDEAPADPAPQRQGLPAPAAPDPDLSPVRLLGYPVRRGIRAREHTDALLRECMLLRSAETEAGVPGRLVDLAELLRSRYSAELSEPERLKLEAFTRGDLTVDLAYPRLADAAAIVQQWQGVLAEMDAYSRAEQLLTLATPPEVAELQRWVLGEFLRQLDGEEPQPWPGPVD